MGGVACVHLHPLYVYRRDVYGLYAHNRASAYLYVCERVSRGRA